MPVDEIQHIVVLVGIFIVAVRQIDVCRIGTCYARAFGIIVSVVVDTHDFATLFRFLLVNGRNWIGLAYQFGIVLRTVGSFRVFLLRVRWQKRSIFFDVRAGGHAQTAKQYGL